MKHDLRLDLLGTTVEVECEETSLHELLCELWLPFISAGGDPGSSIVITRAGGGWDVEGPAGSTFATSDVWELVDQVSSKIFQHAVRHGRGFLDLHAGVLERGEQVLVIAGAPGAGKTTLVIDLLQRSGWSYMSDDLAPLYPETGLVATFPKPLSVKDPERWAELLERWGPPSWLPSPKRGFVVPPTAFPYRPAHGAVPSHLVFIDRGGGPAGVETVLPGLALYTFGQLVSKSRLESSVMGALSQLCRRAAIAEVTYTEASEGADLIEAWLT